MHETDGPGYSRREFGQLVLAGLPLSILGARGTLLPPAARAAGDSLAQRIDSRVAGVQLGVQTYSYRTLGTLDDIVKAVVAVRLGEVELMYNHAEAALGAPNGPGEQGEQALREWRKSAPIARFAEVKKKFDDAGIDLGLLCFNMNRRTTDDEIEYTFQMAKALGARAITCSTQVSVAKRVAPFADTHRMMVGYHGHSDIKDPDEVATPESFAAVTS